MLGGSLAAGLGTSLVRLELLVLGIGGEPLQGRQIENIKEEFSRVSLLRTQQVAKEINPVVCIKVCAHSEFQEIQDT